MKEKHREDEQNAGVRFWYALRTFNCQEKKISQFLTEKGCVHFIPMTFQATEENSQKRILVPAIRNLLFVQKRGSQRQMTQLFKECDYPLYVYRHPGNGSFCEIPDRDMVELRLLCDPDFQKTSVYLTQGEAEAMIGKKVRIVKGPFNGCVGRLVRKDKQYYFLKTVIGMGVMMRISRWYCEPV